MPRINRDLERRMAERRERARQRTPRERRYNFTTGAGTSPDLVDGTDSPAAPATRPRAQSAAQAPVRGFQARTAPRRFADYRAEYAYVLQDLRRIVLVVGSLVILLLALWFVLPR
jgi:hypothetical protein